MNVPEQLDGDGHALNPRGLDVVSVTDVLLEMLEVAARIGRTRACPGCPAGGRTRGELRVLLGEGFQLLLDLLQASDVLATCLGLLPQDDHLLLDLLCPLVVRSGLGYGTGEHERGKAKYSEGLKHGSSDHYASCQSATEDAITGAET
jgi:hypothetical protein